MMYAKSLQSITVRCLEFSTVCKLSNRNSNEKILVLRHIGKELMLKVS